VMNKAVECASKMARATRELFIYCYGHISGQKTLRYGGSESTDTAHDTPWWRASAWEKKTTACISFWCFRHCRSV